MKDKDVEKKDVEKKTSSYDVKKVPLLITENYDKKSDIQDWCLYGTDCKK
jgi:hypothetical protein